MSQTLLPRIRRPRRDSQIKAKAILKAATMLFLRDGLVATSMDAVALEAQVSKRTVYSHFGSKEELFSAIIKELCSDVLPDTVAHPDSADGNVEKRLTQIGIAFLSNIYSQKQLRLYRTVVSASRDYPEIGRIMSDGPVTNSRKVVARYLEAANQTGAIDVEDCEFAAAQFLGMLKTDLHVRLTLNNRVAVSEGDIKAISGRCARLFLRGAGARKA